MKNTLTLTSIAAVAMVLALPGCVSMMPGMPDMNRINQQSALMQQLLKEPDLPQWYTQREGISPALGDRVFDKAFERVFDSLTVAVASLGAHVENMERQSGYMSARGTLLPPEQTTALRRRSLVEYCQHHGYDLSLLERRGEFDIDPAMGTGMMDRMATTMTLSLVRLDDRQTKVKLRFTGVYYPPYLEELYKAAWPALDKQVFIDKATE